MKIPCRFIVYELAPPRFQCRVCGKMTAGRGPLPYFPRVHRVNGQICPGVYQEAVIISQFKPTAGKTEGAKDE